MSRFRPSARSYGAEKIFEEPNWSELFGSSDSSLPPAPYMDPVLAKQQEEARNKEKNKGKINPWLLGGIVAGGVAAFWGLVYLSKRK